MAVVKDFAVRKEARPCRCKALEEQLLKAQNELKARTHREKKMLKLIEHQKAEISKYEDTVMAMEYVEVMTCSKESTEVWMVEAQRRAHWQQLARESEHQLRKVVTQIQEMYACPKDDDGPPLVIQDVEQFRSSLVSVVKLLGHITGSPTGDDMIELEDRLSRVKEELQASVEQARYLQQALAQHQGLQTQLAKENQSLESEVDRLKRALAKKQDEIVGYEDTILSMEYVEVTSPRNMVQGISMLESKRRPDCHQMAKDAEWQLRKAVTQLQELHAKRKEGGPPLVMEDIKELQNRLLALTRLLGHITGEQTVEAACCCQVLEERVALVQANLDARLEQERQLRRSDDRLRDLQLDLDMARSEIEARLREACQLIQEIERLSGDLAERDAQLETVSSERDRLRACNTEMLTRLQQAMIWKTASVHDEPIISAPVSEDPELSGNGSVSGSTDARSVLLQLDSEPSQQCRCHLVHALVKEYNDHVHQMLKDQQPWKHIYENLWFTIEAVSGKPRMSLVGIWPRSSPELQQALRQQEEMTARACVRLLDLQTQLEIIKWNLDVQVTVNQRMAEDKASLEAQKEALQTTIEDLTQRLERASEVIKRLHAQTETTPPPFQGAGSRELRGP